MCCATPLHLYKVGSPLPEHQNLRRFPERGRNAPAPSLRWLSVGSSRLPKVDRKGRLLSWTPRSRSSQLLEHWGDEEATEWWTGETDKDGNCLEPHSTFSCNPEDWSNEHRNATLFTCSEKHNLCVDAAYVCNGMVECPNGADEQEWNGEETGLDCSEYECPYPELGGLKCDHGWAEWETKLCLHKGWACDDYQDCASGEDEEDCSGSGSGDYSYYY